MYTGKRNMLETTIARYMKMPLALLSKQESDLIIKDI